jgi:hypothetical protein
MKIFTFIFALFLILLNCFAYEEEELENLLDAIKIIESQNGKYNIGKNGELGPYQIKKIVIDDVNRIIGNNTYKYSDALDDNKSREICRIYITYWSNRFNVNTIEAMARIWNGGPRGYLKESTVKYWNNIRSILYEL